MSEASMWDRLRPVLQNWNMDPVRVENRVWPGTPDVNTTVGWIELKWDDRWPPKGGPLALDHVTNEQRIWNLRRWRARGRCWWMLQVGQDWLLLDGWTGAKLLGRSGQLELMLEAAWYGGSPDAPELRDWLNGRPPTLGGRAKFLRLAAMRDIPWVAEDVGWTASKVRAMEGDEEDATPLYNYMVETWPKALK